VKLHENSTTIFLENIILMSLYIYLNSIKLIPCFVSVLTPPVEIHSRSETSLDCLPAKDLKLLPFQPDIGGDFPTVEGGKPRIPHIIHQTYKTEMIPDIYWDNIKSIVKYHPTWAYYFWSDESARKLIAERHPYLLNTYDGYDEGIKRGDALRYVILYEFGGVYLDMDFEALRPFDRATTKYASIITPEVFEHSAFLFDMEYLMTNCIMFSRPNHPFFKYLIETLPEAAHFTHVLNATGPLFVHRQFKLYNNITVGDGTRLKSDCSSNSPYFYKGVLAEDHADAVYVPHTQYFNDFIDFCCGHRQKFNQICKIKTKPIVHARACAEMEQRGMDRKDIRYIFTKHKWSHAYHHVKTLSKVKNIHIQELVPNVIL